MDSFIIPFSGSHIAKHNHIEYRNNNIGYWHTTTIKNFEHPVLPKLKVDKWGQLHIVYLDTKGNDLIHAVKVGYGYPVFSLKK